VFQEENMKKFLLLAILLISTSLSAVEIKCQLVQPQEGVAPHETFRATIKLSATEGTDGGTLDFIHVISDGENILDLKRMDKKLRWKILEFGKYRMILDAEGEKIISYRGDVALQTIKIKCLNVDEARIEEALLLKVIGGSFGSFNYSDNPICFKH
jgi:hypothetical protein